VGKLKTGTSGGRAESLGDKIEMRINRRGGAQNSVEGREMAEIVAEHQREVNFGLYEGNRAS